MARKRTAPQIIDFDNIPPEALVPEDEHPYEIPSHWKWVRFSSIVAERGDSTRKLQRKNYLECGKFPVIDQGQGLVGGYSDDASLIMEFSGAVVVFGDHTRSAKYVDFPFVQGADGTKILVSEPVLDPKYLYLWLEAQPVDDLGYRRHFPILKKTAVPLPPIDEQKAIVEKLQSTNQKIDDVLERLDQFLDQSPQQCAAIIQAGVTGNLTKEWREEHGGTMDTWLNTTVQGLGQVVTGGTPPTKDPANYGPGIAFVKPTDLNQGRHVVRAEATLSAIGAERSRVLPPNSVAMCCIGATITKTGLIEVESATNQQINAVVSNDGSDPVFIYYLFESTRFKQQVLYNSSATTLPIINKGRFSRLPISVPLKSEQTEIAMKLDAAMASVQRAVEVAMAAKVQLELNRSVVRARALRGLV